MNQRTQEFYILLRRLGLGGLPTLQSMAMLLNDSGCENVGITMMTCPVQMISYMFVYFLLLLLQCPEVTLRQYKASIHVS